jgi:hypothetical protein
MNKSIALVLIVLIMARCSGAHYCPSYGKRSVEKPSTFKTKKPK